MFGKFFKSTFTGSMMGAGANVFAVWGYVISHADSGTVEINPRLVAAVIGMQEADVSSAIKQLCAPDPRSRSKIADGRRLIREGEFTFSVPTHGIYRSIRSEEDRRAYNREKQREHRARLKLVNTPVIDSQSQSSLSAYPESEEEEETEPEGGDPDTDLRRRDPDPAGAPAHVAIYDPRIPPQGKEVPPRRTVHLGAATQAFLAVYEAYPNPEAKQKAAQTFQEIAEEYGGEDALSAMLLALFKRGWLKRRPYNGPLSRVPYLATVLEERRFEDKWEPEPDISAVPAEIPSLPPRKARQP